MNIYSNNYNFNSNKEKLKNKIKNIKTNNSGITIVALVVTIVVLLILASITIGSITGDNGIIKKANESKKDTEYAQWEERIDLAIIDAESKHRNPELTDVIEELYKDGIITEEEKTNPELTEDGIITTVDETRIEGKLDDYIPFGPGRGYAEKNETYNDGTDTATIPEGFKISDNEDEQTINSGLVIEDKQGNQFVWIPVENFSEFVRYDFQNDTEVSSEYTEETGDGTSTGTEVQDMYKSVKDNKGFYIGRYEAGNDGDDNAVSKKGVNVYNNIKWGNSMTDETGGAVEKARNFDTQNGYTSVISTLVYGVQWDAIMRWLSEGTSEEQGWLTNSTGKGNYLDSDSTNNPAQTGVNDNYQMKHIYDLAGNVHEWTMEKVSIYELRRAFRGGSYWDDASSGPCSYRAHARPDEILSHIGFRLALYIK